VNFLYPYSVCQLITAFYIENLSLITKCIPEPCLLFEMEFYLDEFIHADDLLTLRNICQKWSLLKKIEKTRRKN